MQGPRPNTVTLVLGGVRSGKSHYAQQLGEHAGRVVFVATAQPGDDPEMQRKVDRHRSTRPPHWKTVEEPIALADAIVHYGSDCDLMIIDCLTFLAANLLDQWADDPVSIEGAIESLCLALQSPPCSIVLVSNEVGSGVVPEYPSGRRFRDLLGEMNQSVARVACNVLLLVAGLPLALKGQVLKSAVLILTMLIASVAWASRTLLDETGRHVTVPDHPRRVVCLVPSATEAVFALGAGEDVVAVSDYTIYPPEALKKPSIGSLVKPSIETILSYHPDLVVGTSIPGSAETASQLEAVGVPLYLVDPQGLAGILHSVDSLGDALNRAPQAAALHASLTRRIEAVKARTAGKPAPTVLMPVWYDPIITIGRHAFITEIIETAGGKSVTDDLIPDWPQVSIEAVIARAPEALLLVRGGKVALDTLQNRPGWSSLTAVQQRKVYYVDTGIQDPSPVAINALEELAREFHP